MIENKQTTITQYYPHDHLGKTGADTIFNGYPGKYRVNFEDLPDWWVRGREWEIKWDRHGNNPYWNRQD